MNQEFIDALDEIEKEKGISKEIVFEALESALVSSYRKNYGTSQNVIVNMNRETGEIKLYASKEIVEEVEDEQLQISLENAKQIDKDYELGDVYNVEIHPKNFGRIAAQTAKQVVIQRIKDAQRDVVFDEYVEREKEIITGVVQRTSHSNVYVDLGKTEAVLPFSEQIKGESYEHGDRYKMLILSVAKSTKGPQIVLSRSHPDLVKRLFELEVPEVTEGIVEIYSISREAGSRTKIAVFSRDEEVDPLGACVGYKGQRVNSIVDELHNEKIDIVIYEKEIDKFIANSLSPSKVEKVFINEEEKSALAIVPDYQLSLAIGKEGQNVRLAAKLTGWKIDIKSVEQFENYLEEEGITEDELAEEFSKKKNTEENLELDENVEFIEENLDNEEISTEEESTDLEQDFEIEETENEEVSEELED
ncbi:transcription termination factor NusA [Peptoniphilus sp. MSJ-1]|uniref:Transcription termination/antitermination protein NusA n=1 Tax=Peptoniphilus ovalis TaxID=2841503 RepID=A0ABS6FFX7_9FIRM|nr:transcription termination factor NusA [Peptoniphilus ovalis]MBU5669074.1 transcription termination factor NusA [Peptoniphilus ovalis]